MHCIQSITADICYVGASDRRLSLFENVYPIPRGVSYNSYLVLDEKTVLLDTVDKAVGDRFWENVEYGLQGRPLDYVVVNHMGARPLCSADGDAAALARGPGGRQCQDSLHD